jgi:hypothetical protein
MRPTPDPDRHLLPREALSRESFPFRVGHPQLYDLRGTIFLDPDAAHGLEWAAQHAPVRIRLTEDSQPAGALHARWDWRRLVKTPDHPDEWIVSFDPFEEPYDPATAAHAPGR